MIAEGRFAGLRASIVGAGREGIALARYLVRQGAAVTLSDVKPAEALAGRLAALEGLPVRLALGGNPPELLEGDVLFVSPGVPPTAPIVAEARRRGLPISSEPRLFMQECPAPIVGVTGSSGKTTTTALVGAILQSAGIPAWVGGNIGAPLIERLLEPRAARLAVMELSSFQLEFCSPDYQGPRVETARSERSRAVDIGGWSPAVGVITNVTPNHLDRHPSMEQYTWAKWQVLAHQGPSDWAVLNADDPTTVEMAGRAPGRRLLFSLERPVERGAWLSGGALMLRLDGGEWSIVRGEQVRLRGRHNLANLLAAACVAGAACSVIGEATPVEAIRRVATEFEGVPHRLEIVRRRRGVLWVNDSIATTPERSMAAIRSFQEPLVLLAGGRDKRLPWEDWADLVVERVRAVVAFGEAGPLVERALAEARARRPGVAAASVRVVQSLEEAVAAAAALAAPGDVVLLSPGGTSFDGFGDFEERGARFRALVGVLD